MHPDAPAVAPDRVSRRTILGAVLVALAVTGGGVGFLVARRSMREAAAATMIAGHVALINNRLSEARDRLLEVKPSLLPARALEQYVNDLALTHFRRGDWKSQLELADRARNDPSIPVRRLAPYILVDGLALAGNDRGLVHVVDSITTMSNPTAGSTQRLLARAMERAALFGFDSAARVLALAFEQVSEKQRDSTPAAIVVAMHFTGRDAEAVHIADSLDARAVGAPPAAVGAPDLRSGARTLRAIAHLWAGDSTMARSVLAERRREAAGRDLRGTAHLQAASIATQLGLRAEAIALLSDVVPNRLTFQGGWPESVLLLPLRREAGFRSLIAPR